MSTARIPDGTPLGPTYEIQLVHKDGAWHFALTIVNQGSEWRSPLVSLMASDYAGASAEAQAQVRLLLTYFEGREEDESTGNPSGGAPPADKVGAS